MISPKTGNLGWIWLSLLGVAIIAGSVLLLGALRGSESSRQTRPADTMSVGSGAESRDRAAPGRAGLQAGPTAALRADLREQARQIARNNPMAGCRELVEQDAPHFHVLIPLVFEEWLSLDPAGAARNLEALAGMLIRSGRELHFEMPDLDENQAREYWSLDPSEEPDTMWRRMILSSLARSSPLDAIRFMQSAGLESVAPDVESTLACALAEDGLPIDSYAWSKSEPFWQGVGLGLRRRFQSLADASDVTNSLRSLEEAGRGPVLDSFLSGLARTGDHMAADALLECATDMIEVVHPNNSATQVDLLDQFLSKYRFFGGDFEDALSVAGRKPGLAQALSRQFAATDPAAGAAWVETLDPGMRPAVTSSFVAKWMEEDSIEASNWVNTLESGPDRDAAIVSMVRFLHEKNDQESASEWLEEISNPALRQELAR